MRVPRRAAAAALLLALVLTGCSAAHLGPARSPVPSAARPSASARPSGRPTPAIAPIGRMAALGDSLSRGFDACSHYGDCPSASWSTGDDPRVDSIADRIAAETGRRPTVFNDAQSGTDSSDLARQVDLAIAQRPDVVTVLIGANDACRPSVDAMTPPAEYASRVGDGLTRLARALPRTRILVASVPDVTALIPAAAGNETARFVWSRLGACQSALADPQSTAVSALAQRSVVHGRIEAYDRALQDACTILPTCVYDRGALTARRPSSADLSPLDFFHPSIQGLQELAEVQWQALRPVLRVARTA